MAEYRRAVELQPGYVTAWNNLGDAYEKLKSWRWVLGCKVQSRGELCSILWMCQPAGKIGGWGC